MCRREIARVWLILSMQSVSIAGDTRNRDNTFYTHCNTLQHTATHCNTLGYSLQHTATYYNLTYSEHEVCLNSRRHKKQWNKKLMATLSLPTKPRQLKFEFLKIVIQERVCSCVRSRVESKGKWKKVCRKREQKNKSNIYIDREVVCVYVCVCVCVCVCM